MAALRMDSRLHEIELREEDNSIRLKREIVIEVPKQELVSKLSSSFIGDGDRENFERLCHKLEQLVAIKFRSDREEITGLYELFNPLGSLQKLERFSESEVKEKQKKFLELLSTIMEKSNFKPLSDHEWKLATSSQYLFHLSTKIKRKKLDDQFFKGSSYYVPDKDLGSRYVIFRRGIGIDRRSGQFYRAKIDCILKFCWTKAKLYALQAWNWLLGKPITDGSTHHIPEDSLKYDKYICVRRIHVSNSFKFSKFFGKLDLQEPTFDQMIIVYRKATSVSHTSCHGEQGINIKHYKGIPMADMELILPAKQHPKLPFTDWIILLVFFFISLVGILSGLKQHNRMGLVIAMIVAFSSYATKVYLTFNMNVLEYERLINKLMEDKQLDCGHGTLLHVVDEAVEQEVKETIIAYYVLYKYGGISKEDLQNKSNAILMDFYRNGTSEFQVDDALRKLLDFGIVENTGNILIHKPLPKAIEIIHDRTIQYL